MKSFLKYLWFASATIIISATAAYANSRFSVIDTQSEQNSCETGSNPVFFDAPFSVPAHAAYTRWDFGPEPVSNIEYLMQIHNDPGEKVGLYLAPLHSKIDGFSFYLGIQTNMNNPEKGLVGRGVVFSTWGTFDEADTRPAPGGFIELGTHEGKFAGVRLNYPWTKGEYRLRLSRVEGDANGDWFEFYIKNNQTGVETFAGALRFRRADRNIPAAIRPRVTTFVEVYYDAKNYSDVPKWHIDLMASANGKRAISAKSEYPAFPTAEYPYADVYFDSSRDRVHMIYGGDTPRCHPAGPLF